MAEAVNLCSKAPATKATAVPLAMAAAVGTTVKPL